MFLTSLVDYTQVLITGNLALWRTYHWLKRYHYVTGHSSRHFARWVKTMEIINIKLQIKAMHETSSSYSGNNGRFFLYTHHHPPLD